MNYELIMLREAVRMKRSANVLKNEINLVAPRSYVSDNWRDGTIGQMLEICNLQRQIAVYEKYYDTVIRALKHVPKGYRALLVAIYLKNTDKEQIVQKYKVSVSTIYRKLCLARKLFLKRLYIIGCTESWFLDNFGDIDLHKQHQSRKKA